MFIRVGPGLLFNVLVMLWINVAICSFIARDIQTAVQLGYLFFLVYRLRRGAPRPHGLWNRPHLWRPHESEGKRGQSGRSVGMFRIFHIVLRDTFP